MVGEVVVVVALSMELLVLVEAIELLAMDNLRGDGVL